MHHKNKNKLITMRATLNRFYHGRHRNQWGVWQYTSVTETGSISTFIMDAPTYEMAVMEVYRLNGWGTPKTIQRLY